MSITAGLLDMKKEEDWSDRSAEGATLSQRRAGITATYLEDRRRRNLAPASCGQCRLARRHAGGTLALATG